MKIQVNNRNYIIFFWRKNFPTNVGSVRIFDTDCNISGYKIPKKVNYLNNLKVTIKMRVHPAIFENDS